MTHRPAELLAKQAWARMRKVLARLAEGGLSVEAALQQQAAALHVVNETAQAGVEIRVALRELAAQLAVADRTRDAETIIQALLLLRDAVGSEWTLSFASELRVWAEICRREERYEEAIDALTRAKRMLSGERVDDDEDHGAELARTLNDLALVLQRLGQLTKASHEMKRAVHLLEAVAKAKPEERRGWHELGVAWSNQGVLLGALGDRSGATEAFLQALESLHPDHDPARYAQALHNLGVHLLETGDAERACTMLERALELRRKHLADGDVRLPKTLLALSRAYRDQHDAARALGSAQEAFTRAKHLFPPGHKDLEQIRELLAGLLSAAGRLEEAALLQRSDDFDVC